MTFKKNWLRIWGNKYLTDVFIYSLVAMISYQLFQGSAKHIPADIARLFAEYLRELGEVITSSDNLSNSLFFYLLFMFGVIKLCYIPVNWIRDYFYKEEEVEGEPFLMGYQERELKWLL